MDKTDIRTNSSAAAPSQVAEWQKSKHTPHASGYHKLMVSNHKSPAPKCAHCATPCTGVVLRFNDKAFCCQGCQAVFQLLGENGLSAFYELQPQPGIKIADAGDKAPSHFHHLDDPSVRLRILDYEDEQIAKTTLNIPSMHCVACIWLLENLFKLNSAISACRVHFPRKQLNVSFDPKRIKLSELAALLASIGYEPEFSLSDLHSSKPQPRPNRLWVRIGVAGFAFGNSMLLSLAHYFGLDPFTGPEFKQVSGVICWVLATAVIIYSASDYWKAALLSLKLRVLNIDVPIAAGIVALYAQSAYEVFTGRGDGYFDSLNGLVFFLLCGKLFQQKSFELLNFNRDYKSFFPLSALKVNGKSNLLVPITNVAPGDELEIRNNELIPVDSILLSHSGSLDYSFVTGESVAIEKQHGDRVFAGGRNVGSAIRIRCEREANAGYLTSLWNQELFKRARNECLDELTNAYSQRFTKLIVLVALGARMYWLDKSVQQSVHAFVSVLIVACPCALALAAPFTLGTTQRVLAQVGVFIKNTRVVESLSRITTIIFDKTGTLTTPHCLLYFKSGTMIPTDDQWRCVKTLATHSTHPLASRIVTELQRFECSADLTEYEEVPGMGLRGVVGNRELLLGSMNWLAQHNIKPQQNICAVGPVVHFACDGDYLGCFTFSNSLRSGAADLLKKLRVEYELALLSGDNDRERAFFQSLLGTEATIKFNQDPWQKQQFVEALQSNQRSVLMIGDGLNDAGAFRQSDVSVAVATTLTSFTPASDLILTAPKLTQFHEVLKFAKRSIRIVRWSFLISAVYNVVGISIAATGNLSPLVCAVLMPLSSVTVVAFACGATFWSGRKLRTSQEEFEFSERTQGIAQ